MNIKRPSKARHEGMIAGLYDLGETIGKGHYAVVKLARHVFTGEKVAVKVIDKTKLDEVSRAHLFQEVRCMKLVQHPNVVRLYEVIDTQTKLYLILEWGDGGDLYDYILKHDRGLSEDIARVYFAQIVQAISYCHKLHVVHRDLKPENVVFFENVKIVKLTDFGFSNKFVPGRKLDTSCGSLAYSAPEILLGDSYDAPAVDIWSLGVILYMLVCGNPPFQEANDSETLTMIMDCRYHVPPHISAHCQDMISRMLVKDPSKRTTLEDIVSHPWMESGSPMSLPQVPLVCREALQEEDQAYIMQKIVDGNIATKQEILECLEQSEYNYITATYYLLAERLLRKRNESLTMQSTCQQSSVDLKPVLSPLALSPRMKSPDSEVSGDRQRTPFDSLVSPPGTHPSPPSAGASGLLDKGSTCRCPLIHDMSPPSAYSTQTLSDKGTPKGCPLINEELMSEGNKTSSDLLRQLNIRQSLSDSRLKGESPMSSEDAKTYHRSPELLEVPSPRLLPPTRPSTMTGRPLFSVHSSPQLLNEICEECESDSEGGMEEFGSRSPHTFRQQTVSQAIVSPEVMRKFERLHKMRPSASQRATSCSSSDTSDTDEIDLSRIQTDMTKQKFRRRDSSEHSSDTDGAPSGPSSFSGRGGGRGPAISSGNTHGGGGQSGSKGKSDTGKGKEKTSENNQGKHSSQNIRNEKRERATKIGQHCAGGFSNRVAPSNVGGTPQCKFGDTGRKATPQGGNKTGPNKGTEVQITLNCVIEVQAYEGDAPPMTKDRTGSQVIHVRSRNFNDLVQKFSTKGETNCHGNNGNGQVIKNESIVSCGLHHLSGTRSKTDANNLTAAGSKCGRTDRLQRLTLGNQTWPRGRKISI